MCLCLTPRNANDDYPSLLDSSLLVSVWDDCAWLDQPHRLYACNWWWRKNHSGWCRETINWSIHTHFMPAGKCQRRICKKHNILYSNKNSWIFSTLHTISFQHTFTFPSPLCSSKAVYTLHKHKLETFLTYHKSLHMGLFSVY